ncbi:NOT2 / NOT3 / NOT5 family protein [Histomonas meleagridis]|uniref:NOT2 / NOT3 / NOT5 family protein n=1 Tax=Histomonas meleagridis TaxID=135588 RepID=UPI00355A719E|nr:NOT2 / NOT3 / NOT5 family protein [Histomonas meleagridis]KAH0799823.1 NOT2 / NOT3 / NOT5 family protein [Histomonas meleagridis]
MSRVNSSYNKKLDEEFPSFSSLPKRNQHPNNVTHPPPSASSAPVSNQPESIKKPIPQPTLFQQLNAFGIKSPEAIFQSDLSQQDFAYALSSSQNLIPDPPYDMMPTVDSNNSHPNGYPQKPLQQLLQPETMRKYDLSTLFFIFYYTKSSITRYFAGKELKRRDWLFDTNLQIWLRKAAEPTEKTSEYELGKFEYFDPNDRWEIQTRNQYKLIYNDISN